LFFGCGELSFKVFELREPDALRLVVVLLRLLRFLLLLLNGFNRHIQQDLGNQVLLEFFLLGPIFLWLILEMAKSEFVLEGDEVLLLEGLAGVGLSLAVSVRLVQTAFNLHI